VLANNDFVITWQDDSQDGDGFGIYAQIYSQAGVASGSNYLVNTNTTDNQKNPQIAKRSSSGFIICWDSEGQDGSGKGVYAQRFAGNGDKDGIETKVNTHTSNDQFDPQVAMLVDGSYIISWTSMNQVE